MTDVKREPVDFRFDALNWEFIKAMAQIARYAETKYGSPEQYTKARLTGEKGPLNHIAEHLRAYLAGEEHDHFHTRKHQLAAIAYNASMEFLYEEKFGFIGSPLLAEIEDLPCEVGPPMTEEEFEIFLTKMRNSEDYDYDYDRAPEAPVYEPSLDLAAELETSSEILSTTTQDYSTEIIDNQHVSIILDRSPIPTTSILDKLPKALRKFVK